MIDFQMETQEEFRRLFTLGPEIAAEISKLFPKPCKLEFEKIYCPMMLTDTKKVYSGVLWTNPDKPDKLDAKGFKHIKRDTCQLVARTGKELTDRLMMKRDVVGAVNYLLDVLEQIHNDTLPLEDYIITVMLSRHMDLYTDMVPAHVELARRLRDRDSNNAPLSGDRIPFVAVDIDDPNFQKKLSERIEDPVWATKHGMKLDRHWYIRVQLQEPCIKVLKQVLANPMEIFDRAAARQKRQQSGIQELSFLKKKTDSITPVEPQARPTNAQLPSWLKLFVPETNTAPKPKQTSIFEAFGATKGPRKSAQVEKAIYRPPLAKQHNIGDFFKNKK